MSQLDPITFSYLISYSGSLSSHTSDEEGIFVYYPDKMTVERSVDTLRVAFSGHSTISDLYSSPAKYFSLEHDHSYNLWIYTEKADIQLGDGGNSDVRIKGINRASSFVSGNGNDNINILTSEYHTHTDDQLISVSSGDGNDAITIDTHENGLDIALFAIVDAGNGDDYITVELRGENSISAGAGDDTIITDSGNDYIDGGVGENDIFAGLGVDIIHFDAALSDYNIEVIEPGKVLISKLNGEFETHLIQDAEYFEFSDQTISLYDVFDMPDNYYLGNIDDFTFNFTGINSVEILSNDTGQVTYTATAQDEFIFSNATLSYDQLLSYSNQDTPILYDGNSPIAGNWRDAEFKDGKLYLNAAFITGEVGHSYSLDFNDMDHVVDVAYVSNYSDTEIRGEYDQIYDFTFNFGGGDDYLDVSHGYIIVNAGGGDDFIESGSLDDILNGEGGNDSFNTSWGDDFIDGGEGSDTAVYNDLGSVSGSLYSGVIANLVNGTVHKHGVYVDRLVNVENITGSEWSDDITGNDENNILSGLDGEDVIVAGVGDDTLNGGQANDRLFGGVGDDTYIWNINDGNDVIKEEGGLDKIVFGPGITLNDITFETSGNSFYIHIGDEFITIDKQYGVDSRAVDSIVFVDGGEVIISERMHFIGSEEGETITAFSANDVLEGFAGDDVLIGSTGNEFLDGGAGRDIIRGGEGDDTIDGGEGDDTVDYSTSAEYIYINLQYGLVDEGRNNSWNDTLTSIESAIGSMRSDKIIGNDLGNTLSGLDGDDNIFAYGGDDVVHGGEGNDRLYSGIGQDQLFGDNGRDYLYGDIGGQIMHGGSGNDTIQGKQGDDFIYGDADDDYLYGDEGLDTIEGGAGRDYIYGGDDNDIIDGGAQSDALFGEQGDDVIRGGEGVDYIYGDFQGGDYIVGGDDTLYGDGGNDIIKAGRGNDTLFGGDGNDRLVGHAGQDSLYGDDGYDFLYGGDGNDILNGNAGQDRLFGDDGDDVLWAGEGADYLYGGAGTNIFAIYETSGNDNDMAFVQDWNVGLNNAIDISDLLSGYDSGTDELSDFVTIAVGSNTTIQVDRDGGGSEYGVDNVLRLQGVSSFEADVDMLVANGALIVV